MLINKINNYFELLKDLKEAIYRRVRVSDRIYATVFFCEDTHSIRTRLLTCGADTPILLIEDLTLPELIVYTNIQKELESALQENREINLQDDPYASASITVNTDQDSTTDQENDNG